MEIIYLIAPRPLCFSEKRAIDKDFGFHPFLQYAPIKNVALCIFAKSEKKMIYMMACPRLRR